MSDPGGSSVLRRLLPPIGSPAYHLLLGCVAIFILGPLGGISAALMNFSSGFFIGGQVLAGILGSTIALGYGPEGKHGANYVQTMASSVAGMCGLAKSRDRRFLFRHRGYGGQVARTCRTIRPFDESELFAKIRGKIRGLIRRKRVERFRRVCFTTLAPCFPVSFELPCFVMIASLLRDFVLVCLGLLVSEGYVVIEATRAPEGYENDRGFFFGVELGAPA